MDVMDFFWLWARMERRRYAFAYAIVYAMSRDGKAKSLLNNGSVPSTHVQWRLQSDGHRGIPPKSTLNTTV